MRQIRYEFPADEFGILTDKPIVFLAGPTVRGHQLHLQPSWRFEAARLFEEKGFDGSLIIPEFEDVSKADKGNEDWIVPWEYQGLIIANVILFWIPRTKELIGLNTNFEFGYWIGVQRQKIIYGRPDDSYRNKYLDVMRELDANRHLRTVDKPIYSSLESACDAVIEKLKLKNDKRNI